MTDVSEQSVADVLTAPDRFQCVMGSMGVRLWSADRPLPDWAKHDVVTEYVKAEVVARLVEALEPFAKLELPPRAEGNAGLWSILHAEILAARAAIDAALLAAPRAGEGES